MTSHEISTDFNQRVGANVRLTRKEAGLSQADLAQALSDRGYGFQQQTILKIEKGSRPLKLDEAAQVADVLGVSVRDLFSSSPGEDRGEAIRQLLVVYGRHTAAERRVERAMQELEDARADLTKLSEQAHELQQQVNTKGDA